MLCLIVYVVCLQSKLSWVSNSLMVFFLWWKVGNGSVQNAPAIHNKPACLRWSIVRDALVFLECKYESHPPAAVCEWCFRSWNEDRSAAIERRWLQIASLLFSGYWRHKKDISWRECYVTTVRDKSAFPQLLPGCFSDSLWTANSTSSEFKIHCVINVLFVCWLMLGQHVLYVCCTRVVAGQFDLVIASRNVDVVLCLWTKSLVLFAFDVY